MCGICGVATARGPGPAPELIERMCSSLTHRGPDDQGMLVRGAVGLGIRRLSIIDVAGGHQPIHNEDETIWIVFNGEMYNFGEVRQALLRAGHEFHTRSDTEVVVHAYEEWGDGFLAHVNGMFALAIWDMQRNRVLLARDRMGIKPLFYSDAGGRLVFGSELKALLQDPAIRREVDLAALDAYLGFEYVPAPMSILSGVAKLPAASTLTFDLASGASTLSRYWSIDLESSERGTPAGSLDEMAAGVRSALREAVRKELVSDVPLGVFLSGGIDSSAVAAMMAELTPGNVRSFSIGFEDPSFDESAHARLVAGHLGTDHSEMRLEPDMMLDLVPKVLGMLDEPLADASIIPTYLLSEFTRRSVTVALGGDGGDELFAGYPTMQAHRLAGYYRLLPAFVGRGLIPAAVDRLPISMDNISFDFKARRFVSSAHEAVGSRHARWMGSFAPEQRAALLSEEVLVRLAASPAHDPVAGILQGSGVRDPLNQAMLLDLSLYLQDDILAKVDRASMMASLEARVPLLNVDFVEHVTRLPMSVKLRGLKSKFILKRALRGLLPDSILDRPKKGFGIPVAKWFRGPLKDQLRDALAPEKLAREGFFNPKTVAALVGEHLAGTRDNRKQLWTLFVFESWLGTYLPEAAA